MWCIVNCGVVNIGLIVVEGVVCYIYIVEMMKDVGNVVFWKMLDVVLSDDDYCCGNVRCLLWCICGVCCDWFIE